MSHTITISNLIDERLLEICGIREFTFPDGSVRRLFVCFLVSRKDHPEATASLCVYNNRCTSCTYNMRTANNVAQSAPKRDSTAAIAANQQLLALLDGADSDDNDDDNVSTVMEEVAKSGLHLFNDINGHASWSLKARTGIDVFDTIRNPGHTIELGIMLRVQQAILCKIDQIAKAAARDSKAAELRSFVSSRIAVIYALHPHFTGVRKPNGDTLHKLANSKLLATEAVSLAPLLLFAIRGIEALRPAANLLIVTLQVCSFAYAAEATERMLNAWDVELKALSSRLQSDALLVQPPTTTAKQSKEQRMLRAKTNRLTREVKKLKVKNKELLRRAVNTGLDNEGGNNDISSDDDDDDSNDAAPPPTTTGTESSKCMHSFLCLSPLS